MEDNHLNNNNGNNYNTQNSDKNKIYDNNSYYSSLETFNIMYFFFFKDNKLLKK